MVPRFGPAARTNSSILTLRWLPSDDYCKVGLSRATRKTSRPTESPVVAVLSQEDARVPLADRSRRIDREWRPRDRA